MAEIARENQSQNQNENENESQNPNAGDSSEPKEIEEKPMDLKGATQVLSLLQSHTQDTNAFVRAASLRTLSTLCEKGFIPLSLFVGLTESCVDRLKDKAVLVRKNAIGVFLCIVLAYFAVVDRADGEQSVRSQLAARRLRIEAQRDRSDDERAGSRGSDGIADGQREDSAAPRLLFQRISFHLPSFGSFSEHPFRIIGRRFSDYPASFQQNRERYHRRSPVLPHRHFLPRHQRSVRPSENASSRLGRVARHSQRTHRSGSKALLLRSQRSDVPPSQSHRLQFGAADSRSHARGNDVLCRAGSSSRGRRIVRAARAGWIVELCYGHRRGVLECREAEKGEF